MPRVLYFTRGYTWHDRQFLEGIVSLGYRATLLSLNALTPRQRLGLPRRVSDAGTIGLTRPLHPRDVPRAASRFRAACSAVEPDLVHAGPITDCAFLAATAAPVPVVACSWAFDVLYEAEHSGAARRRASSALRRCAGLVTDCHAVAAQCRRLGARPRTPSLMFPWGIQKKYRPPPQLAIRARRIMADRAIVLSTRSMEPLYDHATLLRAFSLATRRIPSLFLVLLGDGSERARLEILSQELGLRGKVHFAGAVSRPDTRRWFASSLIFCSSALTDGTSVSLLEAMAWGVVPVVSDLPSNREWIRPGSNGWLGACRSPTSFSRALIAACEQPEGSRLELVRENRRLVNERADWERNIRGLADLYQRLMNLSSPKSFSSC